MARKNKRKMWVEKMKFYNTLKGEKKKKFKESVNGIMELRANQIALLTQIITPLQNAQVSAKLVLKSDQSIEEFIIKQTEATNYMAQLSKLLEGGSL